MDPKYWPSPALINAQVIVEEPCQASPPRSYYQEPQAAFSTPNMSATAMAYGSEYGLDTRAHGQGFGNYNAGMMMAPDVASTYFSSEAGATATPGMQHSAQSSSVYQQHTAPLNYVGSISSVNTIQQQPPSGVNAAVSEDHDYYDPALQRSGRTISGSWESCTKI